MKQAIATRKKQVQDSLKESKKELAAARKHLKGLEKEKDRSLEFKAIPVIQSEIGRLKGEIDFLDKQISFLGATVHPIQFENGCVINLNLVKEYEKRMPTGSLIEAELVPGENPLVLLTHKNGKFTLNDLSKYYKGLKLPKGEELFESIGITTR